MQVSLAVACHPRNATAGQPRITAVFPLHRGYRTHMQQHDCTEAFGVRQVGGGSALCARSVLTGAPAKTPAAPAPSRPSQEPDLFS